MNDQDKEDEVAEAYAQRLGNARTLLITMALSTATAHYASNCTDPEGRPVIEDDDLSMQYESLEAAARHLVATLRENS